MATSEVTPFVVTRRGIFYISVPLIVAVTYAVFSQLDEDQAGLAADIANPAFAALSTALALTLYWINRRTPFREIGPGLVAFIGLMALGELSWSVQAELLGVEPDVSVADVFWIAGYVWLVTLLLRLAVQNGVSLASKNTQVIAFFWMLYLPLLSYVIYYSFFSEDLSLLEKVVWNVYTVLDGLILTMLIFTLLAYRRGQLEEIWSFVAVSMVFMAVGDMAYTVYDAAGRYHAGSLPDVFYVVTYILMSLGFAMPTRRRVLFTSLMPTAEPVVVVTDTGRLEPRKTYLVWGNDQRKGYEMLRMGIEKGLEALVIAKKPPHVIKEAHGLKDVSVLWLSTTSGEGTVYPSNLGIISDTIANFMERGPNTIVLLDGFETLITYSDFRKALLLVDHLKNIVATYGSRLIVAVDRRTLSDKEAALLSKGTEVVLADAA